MSRSTKFVSDSFEFSFADKKAQFLEREASEFNEKSINEQKRRKHKSTKNSNNSSADVCRNCFITSNQQNQSSSSFKKQKCHEYDRTYFYQKCFYLFFTLVSEN